MKMTKWNDAGFTSGWRFQWGRLTGGLDPFRGPLAPANHVGKAAAVVLAAVSVSACALDKLAKPDQPSAFQLEQERKMEGLQSELTSVRAELAKVATVQAAPVPQPVALSAPPVPEPVKPPCQPVFRVSYCDSEGNEVLF